ncbi:MAG: response regulator transcription factor [Bacteroidales bacterium]|nr:response regulator transcription factor [Bacteroidales bacterium]
MKIRCIAIDDEPLALDKLKNYIERIPFMELVALCASTTEAMQVMSEAEVDAMFVDINMPDVCGMEFVRALSDPPLVVFTTAYSEYAVDSYKVHAVDYLLKPFGFEDFQRAACNLQKAMPASGVPQPACVLDALFLKVDYRYVRVALNDVIYVEGMNEYLKFYLTSGDPLLTHTTFKQLNECLPDCFLQVHRSYVVNMNHIREVERSVILMSNGAHVSISDGNKDAFMQYLRKHSIRK